MMRNSTEKVYDVIVVGAGPIGMTCGIEAQRNGLDYLIIEKGALVNSIYRFPTNMTFFSTSQLLEVGGVPFISHSDKPTRTEALEYFRRVNETHDLHIHLYEKVEEISKDGDIFLISTDKGEYRSNNVVIATGFYDMARKLNVPGEELPKVKHYYDEPHPYVGQKVAVIGAANSACDVALELFHKGAEVTMVIRKGSISERVKYWIRPNIENRIKEGSIKTYFNSVLREVKPDHIVIDTPDGTLELENDFVLAMTGYRPDFALYTKLGGKTYRDEQGKEKPFYSEDTHESNVVGLFLAGVFCGGMHTSKFFIENSRDHAEKIMETVKGRKTKKVEA